MPKRTSDYRASLLEELKDPAEASHYLNAALRDSPKMFLMALRDVAEAHQMSKVAKDAGVTREAIYRMLSPSGNPTYSNLIGILRALDIELAQVRSAPSGRTRRRVALKKRSPRTARSTRQ
jgi:probable addiction module antidote protein